MLARWLRSQAGIRVTLLVPDLFPRLAGGKLAATIGVDHVEVRRRRDVTGERCRPDLVWYPWNGMTWIAPGTNVATVHDVWPFASPAKDRRVREREQGPYRTTAAFTKAIIANSRFTKSELVKYLPVPPQRVTVVPMGCDPPPKPAAPAPVLVGAQHYVLFVGEREPRKDPETLRTAMTMLPSGLRERTGLVMVGKKSGQAPLYGAIERGGGAVLDPLRLRFTDQDGVPTIVAGEVSDNVLVRLYAGAAVFAFPSRYEGFGIPVVEAMANGIPVVASNAASIPEAGGEAAMYFPPGNAQALATALSRVLEDAGLAEQMSIAGIARAAQLSWDRCSQETLTVFEDAIGASSS